MLHGITQRRVTLWAVALLAVTVLLGSLLVRTVISPGAQAEAATPIRPAGPTRASPRSSRARWASKG